MPDLTLRGFPFPEDTDSPDVPFDFEELANRADAEYSSGLLAARPAFGTVGRRYYATDNGHTYLDIGTAWVDVGGTDVMRTGLASIVNADVSAAAALAYSKLALADSVKYSDMAKDANGLAAGAFSGYRSGAAAYATGSVVVFNAEQYDVSSWFDVATGRFTPQVKGIYRFSWTLALDAALTADNWAVASLRKNGGGVGYSNTIYQRGAVAASLNGSAQVAANGSTDYFEVALTHNQGGAVALYVGSGAASGNFFQGELVGRQA